MFFYATFICSCMLNSIKWYSSTLMIVVIEQLGLIDLCIWLIGETSKKLTKHLLFPLEDFWCRLSWIIPSKSSITTIPGLINNYLQIAFGSAAPIALQRENVFSQTKWASTRIPKGCHKNCFKFSYFKTENVKVLEKNDNISKVDLSTQLSIVGSPTFQDS